MVRNIAASLWWLGLSLYLGGMVALGIIVAPALFKGVREVNAQFPGWPDTADSPNQLGGELFGRILLQFHGIEILAIALMAAGVILSGWKLIRSPALNWAQRALLVAAGLIFIYDACSVTPEVFDARTQWRNAQFTHADPATIDARHARFDILHKRDENVGHLKVYTLAALAIISAWGMTAGADKKAPAA